MYLLCLEQEIALYKFPIRTIQNHLHSLIIFLGIKVTFYIFLFKTHIRVSSYFYKKEQFIIIKQSRSVQDLWLKLCREYI